MPPMISPKLDKALRLLVALDRLPQSSHQLATRLETSRPTVVRLVDELRELGCRIDAVREGRADWAYHLQDWGIFEPERVRLHVLGNA
ncbi:MAG: HTH domain-containing protein [Gammaproteobacteria bacterium]|nr:HTH domain-containing protein [Gammaproteobacteria bacterium]